MSALPEADPEATYYQTVEEFFVSRRGDPLFLSNADWTLVRKWRLAGIPLRVVLRGIRDALDAHAHGFSRDRKVGSLTYCAGEVEAACERWQRALRLGGDESQSLRKILDGFAADLERAIDLGPRARAVADDIAAELRHLDAGRSTAELTAWLCAREATLVAALRSEEPGPDAAARAADLERRLRSWQGRMPAKVIEGIRRESLARRILEAHGLPRLSLFHLEGGGELPA